MPADALRVGRVAVARLQRPARVEQLRTGPRDPAQEPRQLAAVLDGVRRLGRDDEVADARTGAEVRPRGLRLGQDQVELAGSRTARGSPRAASRGRRGRRTPSCRWRARALRCCACAAGSSMLTTCVTGTMPWSVVTMSAASVERLECGEDGRDRAVRLADRRAHLGRVHAAEVRRAVGSLEVGEDELRPLRRRQPEQLDDLLPRARCRSDSRASWPRRRTRLASLPRVDETSPYQPSAAAGTPCRSATSCRCSQPVAQSASLRVVVEAARGIEEAVGDDAVVLGPAAGADGEAADQARWTETAAPCRASTSLRVACGRAPACPRRRATTARGRRTASRRRCAARASARARPEVDGTRAAPRSARGVGRRPAGTPPPVAQSAAATASTTAPSASALRRSHLRLVVGTVGGR